MRKCWEYVFSLADVYSWVNRTSKLHWSGKGGTPCTLESAKVSSNRPDRRNLPCCAVTSTESHNLKKDLSEIQQ